VSALSKISIPDEFAVSRAGALKATLRVVPNSSSAHKGSKWSASCEWRGQSFEAVSRSGASHALCRKLVEAGCPDRPLEVFNAEGRLSLTFKSIHRAAGRTIKESASCPIATVPYQPHPHATLPPEGQNRGISPPEVPGEGSGNSRVYGESSIGLAPWPL
jgi:hypothetical protein